MLLQVYQLLLQLVQGCTNVLLEGLLVQGLLVQGLLTQGLLLQGLLV